MDIRLDEKCLQDLILKETGSQRSLAIGAPVCSSIVAIPTISSKVIFSIAISCCGLHYEPLLTTFLACLSLLLTLRYHVASLIVL